MRNERLAGLLAQRARVELDQRIGGLGRDYRGYRGEPELPALLALALVDHEMGERLRGVASEKDGVAVAFTGMSFVFESRGE